MIKLGTGPLQQLLADICDKIEAVMLLFVGFQGFPCWNLTPDKSFTLKSAYNWMHSQKLGRFWCFSNFIVNVNKLI